MFVQGVIDLQFIDEHECRDILTAIKDLVPLAMEVADVRFEAVALSHLDGEKMLVVPLSLPARCVLGEEQFRQLLEVALN